MAMYNYDAFYSALEQGRIEPITFWNDYVSKLGEPAQTQFYIGLLGKIAVEEREGRYNSPMHQYAYHLANIISQQSNIQRQLERKKQALSTDVDERELPEILKLPEIKKDFDKAIQIGILKNYNTLKASKMLLACFCWGLCKQYDKGTISKSGGDKGGFAANWSQFYFIKDNKGKEIDFRQGWQNAKNKNLGGKFNPDKLKSFAFWEALCKELGISE